MDPDALRTRSKRAAVAVIRFCQHLPRSVSSDILSKQLIRSASSVAANYRAVCRSRSRADFVNTLGIVIEEADETLFWLELFSESERTTAGEVLSLKREFEELLRIFVVSRRTVRSRQ